MLPHLWRLLGYPITASDYQIAIDRERTEPQTLDEYVAWLAEFEGSEAGLNADIGSLLQRLPAELQL